MWTARYSSTNDKFEGNIQIIDSIFVTKVKSPDVNSSIINVNVKTYFLLPLVLGAIDIDEYVRYNLYIKEYFNENALLVEISSLTLIVTGVRSRGFRLTRS